ncbi:MAG: RNA polymerase sigma factor [Flavobacteriales bacterium]
MFNLFAVEGYSHQEIAAMLDITESTSKTQYHKAKGWLRARLERT